MFPSGSSWWAPFREIVQQRQSQKCECRINAYVRPAEYGGLGDRKISDDQLGQFKTPPGYMSSKVTRRQSRLVSSPEAMALGVEESSLLAEKSEASHL
jgi:hypothetical protein